MVHVYVQFALPGETGQRQVAAAQVAHDGDVGIGPIEEIQLGVESVAEKELDDQLSGPNLSGQPAQRGLILVGLARR